MKYIDINKRFTEIIAEYIGKGYIINTGTMGGSQGEIGRVDLTDGNEIIRVYADTFHNWTENIEGVEIVVGIAKAGVQPHEADRLGSTIWTSELHVIHRECFYKLATMRDGEDFYGDEDQARRVAAVRRERYIRRITDSKTEDFTDKAMEIAKRIARREFGAKRINVGDVGVYKIDGGYVIAYKSKTYRLH